MGQQRAYHVFADSPGLASPGACLATTDRTAWKNATSSRILSASSCGTDSANAWESSVTTLMKNIFIWHRAVVILEFVGLESAPDWKITRCQKNIAWKFITKEFTFEGESMLDVN